MLHGLFLYRFQLLPQGLSETRALPVRVIFAFSAPPGVRKTVCL
jgi:hypothetical protein